MMNDDEFRQDYYVEFNTEKHSSDSITLNLMMGIKERDEILSQVVLKLFDLLLEKEFDYDITQQLILNYFQNYEIDEMTKDMDIL